MSKSYIVLLVVAGLALLVTRLMPEKMWLAVVIMIAVFIWQMMKMEDKS